MTSPQDNNGEEYWTDALASFQAECPPLVKSKTAAAGKYSYQYADLGDTMRIIAPVLAKHHLAVAHVRTVVDGHERLHTMLLYKGDTVLTSDWPLTGGLPPQQAGSEMTYARRYSLWAILGIAPEGADDDGQAATQYQTARARNHAELRRKASRHEQPPVTLDMIQAATTSQELNGMWARTTNPELRDAMQARNEELQTAAAQARAGEENQDTPQQEQLGIA